MKIVIDRNGRLQEGSALHVLIGDEINTFRCSECERSIRTRVGQLTVHECFRRGDSSSREFHLSVSVEGGESKPLRATVKGVGLLDERVLRLLSQRGCRPSRGPKLQFSHFTSDGAVEELRQELENLGMNILYEARMSGS